MHQSIVPGRHHRGNCALDIVSSHRHIGTMQIVKPLIVIALLALLGVSLWYAYGMWATVGAQDMPGWMIAAIAGGVVLSLLVGCGLMALMFYSSRMGYDDEASRSHFD
jgi:hypothetical protein